MGDPGAVLPNFDLLKSYNLAVGFWRSLYRWKELPNVVLTVPVLGKSDGRIFRYNRLKLRLPERELSCAIRLILIYIYINYI